MFSFWGYLRAKTREAILGGFAEALEELDADDAPDLDGFRKRLASVGAKALPAKGDDDEPTKGRRTK